MINKTIIRGILEVFQRTDTVEYQKLGKHKNIGLVRVSVVDQSKCPLVDVSKLEYPVFYERF